MKGSESSSESGVQIDADRLRVFPAIYRAVVLEEMGFFAAADRVALQFGARLLPLASGAAGDRIFEYIQSAGERMDEDARRSVYARSFGTHGSDVEPAERNDEFRDLWLRFVSSVASALRDEPTSEALVQVHASGRDLALNLSVRGYGVSHAALVLQGQVETNLALLSIPELLEHYGARESWQLVDPKGSYEKARFRARWGAGILQALADRASTFADPFCEKAVRAVVADSLAEPVVQWLSTEAQADQGDACAGERP